MTRHILIVDDEPKVGFFLKESVEALGADYAVAHVPSAEAALAALTDQPYDLVVTDLRMPGMNGLELLDRVRHDWPRLPAILITAYGSADIAAACQRLPPTQYFAKPFRIEEFLQAVQDSLDELTPLTGAQLQRCGLRVQDLRYEVGAHGALLADLSGHILAEFGALEGVEREPLAQAVARSLSASLNIQPGLREERSFNLSYHEGARYDVYAATVDTQLLVALIFDRRQGPNRIGVVWLYLKRAIQEIQYMLRRSDEGAPPDNGWLMSN